MFKMSIIWYIEFFKYVFVILSLNFLTYFIEFEHDTVVSDEVLNIFWDLIKLIKCNISFCIVGNGISIFFRSQMTSEKVQMEGQTNFSY